MEQTLAAVHQSTPRSARGTLGLEFVSQSGQVSLRCSVADELLPSFERQLYAHFPEVKLTRLDGDPFEPSPETVTCERWLDLTCDLFPLKRYIQFEDSNRVSADPLAALLLTLGSERKHPLTCRVTLSLRPVSEKACLRRRECVRRLSHPYFRRHQRLAAIYSSLALGRWLLRPLAGLLAFPVQPQDGITQDLVVATSSARTRDREEDVQAAGDKLGKLHFEASLAIRVSAPKPSLLLTKEKVREIAGAFGIFAGRRARFRLKRSRRRFMLSVEEAATLWHPPTLTVRAPALPQVRSRDLPPPLQLPEPRSQPNMTLLGVTKYRSTWKKFGILSEDRFRHVALLGKTGMGKSTLLERLAVSDIRAGRGVGLIDPHGDLIDAVLRSIPRHRRNDVVLFDPADRDYPVAFNILAHNEPRQRPLIASAVVSAFKKLYADSWGPRLEHIFRNAVLTLLEIEGASLITLVRLLGSPQYRRQLLRGIENPALRAFWNEEFARKPEKFQEEAVAPIQNKVGHFISSPILCNILGQSQSKLDLRAIMDEGKILLCNLSKGKLGDDASMLLGSLLITGLQLAAMSRADVPQGERRDFFLAVDEFQNYATESFATILSEARKYRLALTVANQYLGQLDDSTLHALFGNVGTLACFQVGVSDAELLAAQLGTEVEVQDLMTLPKHHAYVRLLVDGEPSAPFTMQTMPFAASKRPVQATIRRTSRHRYARPLPIVEKEIAAAFAHA